MKKSCRQLNADGRNCWLHPKCVLVCLVLSVVLVAVALALGASAAATAPRAPPAPPIPVICCISNATGLAVCPLHLSAHDMFVFAFWPGLAWRGPHPCPWQLPSVLANFHSRRGNSLTLGFQFRAESNQKCAKFQLPRGWSSWTRRSQMKGEDQEPAMSICLLVVNWPRVMKNNVRIYSICLLKGYA